MNPPDLQHLAERLLGVIDTGDVDGALAAASYAERVHAAMQEALTSMTAHRRPVLG